jgi:hypothetical protein
MAGRWALGSCAALLLAVSGPSVAQQAGKGPAAQPGPKVEKLHCRLGDEDRQARIAVELVDGQIMSFAYYSKVKPRTCSISIERDDAYSKWEDTGRFTRVFTENGDFLIENRKRDVHFIFREVDRHFYCGMAHGTISGTVTVIRGRSECALEGVMDAHNEEEPAPAVRAAGPAAQPAGPAPDGAPPVAGARAEQ